MEYETQAFEDAQDMLFGQLGDDPDAPVVCIEHERFIPCRACMYATPATIPYSDKVEDVEAVRSVQAGNC